MGIIKKLSSDVSRKIAAGEVIERPSSILRELLDNAIDANATEIEVFLTNGGIEEIIVIDNGCGMDCEDLENSILPHSTSKIKNAEDIYNVKTLGFRGEALSSIAACAKLTIISKQQENDLSNSITVFQNKLLKDNQNIGKNGTKVIVKEIFYNLPGRKQFLSSISGETTSSINVYLEKAVSHPNLSFKLFLNDKLKFNSPKESYLKRVSTLFNINESLLFSIEKKFNDYSIDFVCSKLIESRKDRKLLKIFMNGRQINDYAFVQAVEYGYSEFLPGGLFPIGYIFINDRADYLDFNIHPAKKEVKIKNRQEIHHSIVSEIRNYFYKNSISPSNVKTNNEVTQNSFNLDFFTSPTSTPENTNSFFIKENFLKIETPQEVKEINNDFIYLGQIFNLFLLAQTNNNFYIIDQHAAHEKILFEELSSKSNRQKLLFPIELDIENPNIKIFPYINALKTINIVVEIIDEKFFLTELPQYAVGKEDILINFLNEGIISIFDLEKEFLAQIACKKAIKDGDIITSSIATEIIKKAFMLKNPRCPHGRPIWYKLSKDELFRIIGRII